MDTKITIRKWTVGFILFILFVGLTLSRNQDVMKKNHVKASTKAEASGIEVSGSYTHPVTGDVADSGNNQGIGQGMVESIVNKKGLFERDANGNLYITVRFFMMDQISNVRFQIQKNGTVKWNGVSSTIMQKNVGGENCTDYRFKIGKKSDIVEVVFFVEAMGRDVTFFLSFGEKLDSTGDFLVRVNSSSSSKETSTEQSTTSSNSSKEAEELIENANGLVVSDAALLDLADQENFGETVEGETNSTEDGNSTEVITDPENDNLPIRLSALSWTLVFQCILIITVPSLIISCFFCGFSFFCRKN